MEVTQDEAISIAKKEARNAGYNVEKFQVYPEDLHEGWEISFKRDLPGILGASSHFSVYVDKTSRECKIFHGR